MSSTAVSQKTILYKPVVSELDKIIFKNFPSSLPNLPGSSEITREMSLEGLDAVARRHIPKDVLTTIQDVLKIEKFALIAPSSRSEGVDIVRNWLERSEFNVGARIKEGEEHIELRHRASVAIEVLSRESVRLYVDGVGGFRDRLGAWCGGNVFEYRDGSTINVSYGADCGTIVGDADEVRAVLYGPSWEGKMSTYDFLLFKDSILALAAHRFGKSSDEASFKKALDRFDLLPEVVKNKVYEQLAKIQEKEGVSPSWRSGEYAFREEHNWHATPEQRKAAVSACINNEKVLSNLDILKSKGE